MSPLTFVQPDASLAERLKAFVWRVVIAVGERVNRAPEGSVVRHRVPLEVYQRIAEWMQTRRQAIEALMARIEAGKLRASPVYAPRASQEGGEPKARKTIPAAERFPRISGWVCRWAPEAWSGAADLRGLLDDPRMKTLVLSVPERMVRLWNPLLYAVGQNKPDWFPKLPRRPRRSRRKVKTFPCGGGLGWGVDAAGSRGDTPPGAPPTREAGCLTPPPAYMPPPPFCPPPQPTRPPAAPWLGRGPGPCASLAQYRSPFQPGGDEHPRAPPVPDQMPELEQRSIQGKRRNG
jgi:hypothetical protein